MATNEFPSQDIAIPEREVDGPTLSAITSPPVEGKNELMSEKAPQPESPAKPVVIKNRAGNGAWVKMLFIMISVFVLTVAVGMGIGFAVLKITDQNFGTATPSPSPSPLASVSPSPVVSPSPSPQATVNKEDLSILIVNATTKAGYAGGTRTKLDEAGYGSVQAANARGDYEPGIYVLMKDENSALIDTLASDSDLELQFAEGIETEDPRDQYDAVIVLAE